MSLTTGRSSSELRLPHYPHLPIFPHRLWVSADRNTYEVAKARIQLLFLSSQYPCAKLTRHRSHENPLGLCTNDLCGNGVSPKTTL